MQSLSIEPIHCTTQLSQRDVDAWNRLARNPLQRWEWMGSWWDAFHSQYELCVLRVAREDEIVAFAPWCIERRLTTGRTLQFLGSGKACSDHLSLVIDQDETDAVCQAIATWLLEHSGYSDNDIDRNPSSVKPIWDAIEWIGVDQQDGPMNQLAQAMREKGLIVDQTDGMGCYVIELPENWDDYVKMRSKSGRREIRQSLKNIESGKIVIERVDNEQQLEDVWHDFVTLHQRRRHAAGTSGCFDHPGFELFLRKAASRLLGAGLLEFTIAKSDGVPVAAQFAVADQDTWYFYQSGMEPDASELRPGLSVFCHSIRETIRTGRKQFDMMRGDEPYKLRWRAELSPTQEIRLCSPRTAARLRNQVYKAGLTFKNLLKSGIGPTQPQS